MGFKISEVEEIFVEATTEMQSELLFEIYHVIDTTSDINLSEDDNSIVFCWVPIQILAKTTFHKPKELKSRIDFQHLLCMQKILSIEYKMKNIYQGGFCKVGFATTI